MKKILVVDNNPVILQFIFDLLKDRSYVVKTSENAVKAFEIAKIFVPDIFFIDLIMPHIDGEKFTRIIKSHQEFKDSTIVVITATAAEDFDNFRFDDLVYAFIAKRPFKEMKEDIFTVLEKIEKKEKKETPTRIYGYENLYSREITKELLISRNHLKTLIEHISDGFFELNLANKIVNFNAAAVSCFRLNEENLLGSSFSALFPEKAKPVIEEILEKLDMSRQEITTSSPVELYGRFFSISFIPLEDPGCESRIVLFRDVTDHERANVLLMEAKETAEEKNRIKSEFLANISHELRTPLNAIMGYSQLLGRKDMSSEKEKIEFSEQIMQASNHLLEMVNDLLDLSKIEAGKLEITKKLFNPGQLLLDLTAQVSSLAIEKNIDMLVEIDTEDYLIEADETRLKQVLYNLLSNAIKFTPEGKKIGVKTEKNGNEALIEIWDEGIGIDKADLEKIFESFEQVGKIRTQGTGLGLAISRKLISLHGGTLKAERRKTGGSSFTIRLPVITPPEKEIITRQPAEVPTINQIQRKDKFILVVEDNPVNQEIIETILEDLGYSVQIEGSGRAGIEAALNGKFDLVLMDIQLPDMDGVEAMKAIRKDTGKRIPVIALTAYAMAGDKGKYLAKGFDGYITKPIFIEKLEEAIDTLLC